jgi:16S rRNA (guanine(966)-N(2))-methyltransferase RsmD
VRIISGKNKGRKIVAPKNLPVRPTTDMAKESLFNIINNLTDIDGLRVLDLFAGTGNITYEFASRGCKSVTSVDLDNKCTAFISETARKLNYDNIYVIRADYRRFLNSSGGLFDLIFADPPYNMENIEEIPDLIAVNSLMNKNGILIVEHPGTIDFSGHSHYHDHRKYGKVNFTFFSF